MFDLFAERVGTKTFLFWLQRTQAVLQAVSAVQSGGSPAADVQEILASASSPVLRIIIDNMFYPVTLDVLQQVGIVERTKELAGVS